MQFPSLQLEFFLLGIYIDLMWATNLLSIETKNERHSVHTNHFAVFSIKAFHHTQVATVEMCFLCLCNTLLLNA